MLQICAKNAAQASMRRRSGEDKVARKRKLWIVCTQRTCKKTCRARKIRHDRINGEVKDQDLAAFLKRLN